MIRAYKPVITATAQEISSTTASGSAANPTSISIKNPSANTGTIYLGGTNAVTSATGFPIAPGEGMDIDLAGGDDVYAVCATGITATVSVLLTRE